MSIGKYLERKRTQAGGALANPLCLEFGVTDNSELDIFIERHLPTFLLVRSLLFASNMFCVRLGRRLHYPHPRLLSCRPQVGREPMK